MSLTREQILGAADRPTVTVSVPEWGGEVIVTTMSGAARDAWEQSLVGDDRKINVENMRGRLLAFSAVDESGKRLFTDDDAIALGQKSAKALERCVKVIQRLNGLTDRDLEEAKKN